MMMFSRASCADGTKAMGDGGKLSEDSTTIVWSGVPTGQPGDEDFTPPDDAGADLNLGTPEAPSLVSVWLLRESAPTPPRWAMVKISPLLLWSTARRWGIPSKSRTCLPAWQSRQPRPRASNAQAPVQWLRSRSRKATRPGSCRECTIQWLRS